MTKKSEYIIQFYLEYCPFGDHRSSYTEECAVGFIAPRLDVIKPSLSKVISTQVATEMCAVGIARITQAVEALG